MDANTLPKGHIIGWTPPAATSASSPSTSAKSKSAKKNEKRKEKRKEKAAAVVAEKIKDNWEDDDDYFGLISPFWPILFPVAHLYETIRKSVLDEDVGKIIPVPRPALQKFTQSKRPSEAIL